MGWEQITTTVLSTSHAETQAQNLLWWLLLPHSFQHGGVSQIKLSCPNSYAVALIPTWMYLEKGPLNRQLRIKEVIRKGPWPKITRRGSDTSSVRTQERPHPKTALVAVLDCPASRTEKTHFCCLSPQSAEFYSGSPSRLLQGVIQNPLLKWKFKVI